MVLTKEEIWERIRTKSVWLTPALTPIFLAGEEHMYPVALGVGNRLRDQFMRYVTLFLFQGDAVVHHSGSIQKLEVNNTFTVKISDVQIAPAAMPQIPNGGHSIEDPILSLEGNTGLYGQVNGNSVNLTVIWWDDDV